MDSLTSRTGDTATRTGTGVDPGWRPEQFTPAPPSRKQPTTFAEDAKSVCSRRRSTPRPEPRPGISPGTRLRRSSGSRRLQSDGRGPEGHDPGRRPGRVPAPHQQHRRRDGGNGTTSGPLGPVSARAPRARPPRRERPLRLRLEGRMLPERRGRRLSARDEGRRQGRHGRHVVCTFTNTRKGTPPTPPTPPIHQRHQRHRRRPTPTAAAGAPCAARPDSEARPRRHQVGRAHASRRRTADLDDDRDQPLLRRGRRRQRPQARRPAVVQDEADLPEASQGTCRPYTCDLGRLAPGASATVTAVTEATQVGDGRRHRARRLRRARVELPQQRRRRARSGHRAADAADRAEHLPRAHRRATGAREGPLVGRPLTARNRLGRRSADCRFVRVARASTGRHGPTVRAWCGSPCRRQGSVSSSSPGTGRKRPARRKCQTRLGVLGARGHDRHRLATPDDVDGRAERRESRRRAATSFETRTQPAKPPGPRALAGSYRGSRRRLVGQSLTRA